MTSFLDGPAAGQSLMLKRAPIFLRVTHDGKDFDALDQPGDEARPGEKLLAYQLTRVPGHCHMLIRGKGKGASGFYTMATYRYCSDQPDQPTLRDNSRWQTWCEAQIIPAELQ